MVTLLTHSPTYSFLRHAFLRAYCKPGVLPSSVWADPSLAMRRSLWRSSMRSSLGLKKAVIYVWHQRERLGSFSLITKIIVKGLVGNLSKEVTAKLTKLPKWGFLHISQGCWRLGGTGYTWKVIGLVLWKASVQTRGPQILTTLILF